MFKVDVRVGDEIVSNSARFDTEKQAQEYGELMLARWSLARSYAVVPVEDEHRCRHDRPCAEAEA